MEYGDSDSGRPPIRVLLETKPSVRKPQAAAWLLFVVVVTFAL